VARVGALYNVHDRGLDLDEAVDHEAAPLRPVPAGASGNIRTHFLLWLADPRGDPVNVRPHPHLQTRGRAGVR
jgi:hypothetical protein